MTEQEKQAIKYLLTVAEDFAHTLAPSVRGPFVREVQTAANILLENKE